MMNILFKKATGDVIAFNAKTDETPEVGCAKIPYRDIGGLRPNFFKFDGTDIVEKTQAEKDAILGDDQAKKNQRKARKKALLAKLNLDKNDLKTLLELIEDRSDD